MTDIIKDNRLRKIFATDYGRELEKEMATHSSTLA